MDNPREIRPYLQIGPASLGWGMVGASHIARTAVAPAIQSQPSVRRQHTVASGWMAGIYSRSQARAEQFAQETGVSKVFTRLADLLARPEIQCIYISSLPRLHSEQALAALEAGKHVLCESPLALSREAAHLLVRTAQERGLVLAVNHRLRAEPALVRMQQFVAEGGIGDVFGATIHNINPLTRGQHTWRLKPRGGGVIFDRSIHSLDLLRFLFHDEIDTLTAFGAEQAWGDGVFDDVITNVRLRRRGILVQVRDSYIVPHARDRVELYGTSGTLIARGAFLPDRPGDLEMVRHGEIQPIPVPQTDPFWQIIRNFDMAVRDTERNTERNTGRDEGQDGGRNGGQDRVQPICSGADALISLEAALAVQAAANRGQAQIPGAPPV